jgi:taurine-pyruvate aminotransferase
LLVVIGIAAAGMKQGVIIERMNRCFRDFNYTIAFAPASIASKDDIDEIVASVDFARPDG